MRQQISLLTILLLSLSVCSFASSAHNVRGYYKKNGTFVKSHRATNPNKTQRDNWSSKPNINPDYPFGRTQ